MAAAKAKNSHPTRQFLHWDPARPVKSAIETSQATASRIIRIARFDLSPLTTRTALPSGSLASHARLFVAGHKKEAASQRRPHQYLVPRPLYPHPRGGIEILRRIVCTQGPIRYDKLNFLDCCKFATIGAFLRHIVVSSPLSAHYCSIRPKAGRPSPSPDTPWPPNR